MKEAIIFSYYKQLVPFLHQVLGNDSEILLHDTSSPDSSIIALAGNLSKRKIGGPLTDMALKQIKEKKYLTHDFVDNYKSYTIDNKLCRSSSYFIKNDNKELIGLLCINILVSDLVDMQDKLTQLIGLPSLESTSTPSKIEEHENLGQNIDELMSSLIDSVLDKYPTPYKDLSIEQRNEIIAELSEKGVFLLKGGVAEVALKLEMSEPSIYRYIAKIK